MASEYIQDLAFRQLSQAIMATANSVTSAGTANAAPTNNSAAAPSNSAPAAQPETGSIFDVVRRKLGRVQDVIQGIAAPLKRRSLYEEPPAEHSWQAEHIEMCHLVQRSLGHAFVPCQLSNPTWCDYCGDFIWGLYKQCQRCQGCQYTCHQHCIPQVSLSCTSVSQDGSDHPHSATDLSRRSPLESSKSLDSGFGHPTGAARSLNSSPNLASRKNNHNSHPQQQPATNISLTQGGRTTRSASDGNVVVPQMRTIVPGRAIQEVPVVGDPLCLSGSTQSQPDPSRPSEGESHPVGTGGIITHIDHTDLATEKDETDSGYRSGTIPDDKLPKVPSQATLDRQELKRKVAKFNHFVPAASLEVTGKESFQGFLKFTMNLIRPITMELGARPPSIYELLTREHIVEENTQQVAFYMPRDTHKSLHIDSETTTKEVVSSLLKKFHILDHPRKFAMYEQEFNDKNKLVRLRRMTDKDYPLLTLITWDPEKFHNYRMVLQENETGEIVWDAFSLPELSNFLKVLDREERETILELRHKYVYMRQVMEKRLAELRNQRRLSSKSKA